MTEKHKKSMLRTMKLSIKKYNYLMKMIVRETSIIVKHGIYRVYKTHAKILLLNQTN